VVNSLSAAPTSQRNSYRSWLRPAVASELARWS
jgi:hypothetical protein